MTSTPDATPCDTPTRVREAETAATKSAMIAAYGALGTVMAAAAQVGINRNTHYEWLKADGAYALAFANACEDRADILETEATRRAVDGVEKPVYQMGTLVGHVREYSDTLMQTLLKGARPAKFRERHEISGPDGGPIETHELSDVERADRIAALFESARARRTGQTAEGEGEVGTVPGAAEGGGGD